MKTANPEPDPTARLDGTAVAGAPLDGCTVFQQCDLPVRQALSRYVRALPPSDQDDFAQDVWLEVFRSARSFARWQDHRAVTARVNRIAWSTVAQYYRHKFDEVEHREKTQEPMEPSSPQEPNPLEHDEDLALALDVLGQLHNHVDLDACNIYLLCELDGLKPGEVAKRLGWPAGKVRKYLYRARAAIRSLVQQHASGDLRIEVYCNANHWLGERFPFRDGVDIDIGWRLRKGSWEVWMYRAGCPKCGPMLARALQCPRRDRSLALIELPPYLEGPNLFQQPGVHHGRLSSRYDWAIEVPVLMVVAEGLVTEVMSGDKLVETMRAELPCGQVWQVDRLSVVP